MGRRYLKTFILEGHEIDLWLTGYDSKIKSSYFNIYTINFGRNPYNRSMIGFWIIGYEKNHLLHMRVNNVKALDYLKKLYHGL